MKKITGKENLDNAIFSLFFFSILFGIEVGILKDNLTSHGSIILHDTIFSLINLFWLYLAALFGYYSYKEKSLLLRISYLLGSFSFLLPDVMISYLGFKSLYLVKILILLIAISCLGKYTRETFQAYKAFIFGAIFG